MSIKEEPSLRKLEALAKYRKDVESGVREAPTVERNLIKRAEKNPTNLRKAIEAMCFHCVGGTREEMPDPGFRKEISTCSSPGCPLLGHRPFTKRS